MSYTEPRAITDTGAIVNADGYSTRGVGLPDGWMWLDDADSEPLRFLSHLPSIVSDFDQRLRALEER